MRKRPTPSPALPGFEQFGAVPLAPTPPRVTVVDDIFRIEVTRSKKRKKSVGARLVADVLKITVPSWMSRAEEEKAVDRLMPAITAVMWMAWPMTAHRMKRGRSSRFGKVRASLPRNTIASSARPSSGSTA